MAQMVEGNILLQKLWGRRYHFKERLVLGIGVEGDVGLEWAVEMKFSIFTSHVLLEKNENKGGMFAAIRLMPAVFHIEDMDGNETVEYGYPPSEYRGKRYASSMDRFWSTPWSCRVDMDTAYHYCDMLDYRPAPDDVIEEVLHIICANGYDLRRAQQQVRTR